MKALSKFEFYQSFPSTISLLANLNNFSIHIVLVVNSYECVYSRLNYASRNLSFSTIRLLSMVVALWCTLFSASGSPKA